MYPGGQSQCVYSVPDPATTEEHSPEFWQGELEQEPEI